MFTLNSALYGSVFVVPSVIVEKYIKMASFCAIKTLLWILKNQGGNFSIEEIAKAVGSSPADTKEAIDYWINEGVLIDTNSSSSVSAPTPIVSDSHLKEKKVVEPIKQESEPKKATVAEIKPTRPTYQQVIARMDEDTQIAGLLNHAQLILGRSIGYDMQSSLVMMYDTYGLDVEVILTLIQFCINQNKASNAFILSTAKLWYEKDITTLEKANKFIDEHNKVDEIYREFCKYTGITAPKPTPKQTELFIEWDQMGFSVDMMVYAYNEMVERTGKVSFAYVNKVLLNWKEKGYKTPEEVENGNEEFKKQKAEKASNERSYDINKAVEQATSVELVYKKRKRAEK